MPNVSGTFELTELPPGNTTACYCPPCNRVFASEMAFKVHRGGCRTLNEHWKTNLILMPNGMWGTHEDYGTWTHMEALREARKGD